jgi:hypothetical protein
LAPASVNYDFFTPHILFFISAAEQTTATGSDINVMNPISRISLVYVPGINLRKSDPGYIKPMSIRKPPIVGHSKAIQYPIILFLIINAALTK